MTEPEKPPTRLLLGETLWYLAFAAFLAASGLIALNLTAVLQVAETVESSRRAHLAQPISEPEIADAVETAVLSIGGAGIALVMLQLFAVHLLLRGRSRARGALVAAATGSLVVNYLAYDILNPAFGGAVSPTTDAAQYALLAHTVLIVAAVAVILTAPVSEWLRDARRRLRPV